MDVVEREIFGVNGAVTKSQVVTEAARPKASAFPNNYDQARPLAADADFLVGPE